MDVNKYGGYKGITPAYFALIEFTDKKGSRQRLLEAVPLYLRADIDNDSNVLRDFYKNVLGFVYAEENNWKNRGYDTAVIIANVEIGEKPYICEVVVTKSDNRQGFYLHEVEIKENLDGVFKTAINGTPSRSRLIISQYLRKGNEASKIVDENGEPLVVYHGSDADFDTFDRMSHLEVRRLKWFHT